MRYKTVSTLYIYTQPQKAIVVTTDFAQYDLNSTGEALDASNKNFLVTEDVAEYQNKVKETSKSEVYKKFVFEKLMPAEIALSLIGNLYVGFIFIDLLTTLANFYDDN